MIYPAYYEVVIPNQATFSQDFQLKNSAGVALDLTGHTIRASIWTEDKRILLADFTVTWINQVLGKFNLYLSENKTTAMTKNGMWDLLVIYPDLTESYWLRGPAVVAKGYTK